MTKYPLSILTFYYRCIFKFILNHRDEFIRRITQKEIPKT
jgi:hypothetical protein